MHECHCAPPGAEESEPVILLEYYDGSAFGMEIVADQQSDFGFKHRHRRRRRARSWAANRDGRFVGAGACRHTVRGRCDGGFCRESGGESEQCLVVYYNTVASLDSAAIHCLGNRFRWIATTNMGQLEPTYRFDRCGLKATFSICFTQPTGVLPRGWIDSKCALWQISELQWNEAAYFASPTPTSLFWDSEYNKCRRARWRGDMEHFHSEFFRRHGELQVEQFARMTAITFGVTTSAAGTVTLGSNITVQEVDV